MTTSAEASRPATGGGVEAIQWQRWTVILLKPDCLRRGLVEAVLERVGQVVTVSEARTVTVTEDQIFAHYDDMLPAAVSRDFGLDVRAELQRMYVGNQVVVALGHGDGAADRLRAVLGVTDPALAGPDTIRGHFGTDSLSAARAQGRLIDNLIHTSDNDGVVERDFMIWYGAGHAHLLLPRSERTP